MKRIGVFILFLSWIQLGFGQKTIESSVSSRHVGANERFTFEIVINNFECDVMLPNFGGLEVVGGPYQSQSGGSTFENGKSTRIIEVKWTYELRAKEKGTYTISGVTMSCNGDEQISDPIEIEVSEASEIANVDKDSYVLLSTSKDDVYLGEPFTVTLKYYSKAKPESFEQLDLGGAVGIFREDLKPDRKIFQTVPENVDGVRFYTIILREEVCFAESSGELTIDPYYVSALFRRDFFNQYRKESNSNSLKINVKELPRKTAPDFKGLVGDFQIDGEISKNQFLTGDVIDIKITISGVGNFHDLENLDLKIPKSFEQYEPEILNETVITEEGFKGKIEYNFVVIPKEGGNYTIPGYTLQYFDLKSRKMKTAETQEFKIHVDQRDGVKSTPESDPKIITDIQYIEEQSDGFFEQEDFIFGTWTYYGMVSSPLLLSFFFIFFKRKKENLSEDDLLLIQQKKAIKNAQEALKEVQQHLDQGNDAAALKGLQSTINKFFMQKLNVGLSDLSQRSIANRLTTENVSAASIEKFNKIWNAIEMSQYAPIAHENLVQTVNDTQGLLIELDKTL